jgi:hypothetical protein
LVHRTKRNLATLVQKHFWRTKRSCDPVDGGHQDLDPNMGKPPFCIVLIVLLTRAARFVLVQHTKMGGKITKWQQKYQTAITYTKWPYVKLPNDLKTYIHFTFQDPTKFTHIVFGYVCKYAIWQPFS